MTSRPQRRPAWSTRESSGSTGAELLGINPVTQAVQGLGMSLPPPSALAVRA